MRSDNERAEYLNRRRSRVGCQNGRFPNSDDRSDWQSTQKN